MAEEAEDGFIEVVVACGPCRATGLYRGFAEPEGTAVICLKCGGSGGVPMRIELFRERMRREGIHTVSRSQGSFIGTGVGAIEGTSMTYEEFLDRIPPATPTAS